MCQSQRRYQFSIVAMAASDLSCAEPIPALAEIGNLMISAQRPADILARLKGT